MENKRIGEYLLLGTIGSGMNGRVKLAEHATTKIKYAVKTYRKDDNNSPSIHYEIALMRLLDHPNLLKLQDVYESEHHLYMFLEYASHGELFDHLVVRRNLPPEQAMHFFRQIIYGLDFLHSHLICHRDLKPENILLDEYDNIKIGDFGFAKLMRSKTVATQCGSPHYTAPEVIKGMPYDGRFADIWSAGVILYALLAGRLPFDDSNIRTLYTKIKHGQYRMPSFNTDIQDLLFKILTVEPEKRIKIDEIKAHPAFRIGLPDPYSIPVPLSLPSLKDPIQPQTVEPSVISTLKHLGFGDELDSDLTSNSHNMAKMLCFILSGNDSQTNEAQSDGSIFMLSDNLSTQSQDNYDQFGRRLRKNVGSIGLQSLAEHAKWLPELQMVAMSENTQIIDIIGVPIEDIFSTLQTCLTQQGCAWTYPTEYDLLTDELTIRAEQTEIDSFRVVIRPCGASLNEHLLQQCQQALDSFLS